LKKENPEAATKRSELKREAAALLSDAGWPEAGSGLRDILRQRSLTWVTMHGPLEPARQRRVEKARSLALRLCAAEPKDAEAWLLQALTALILKKSNEIDPLLSRARAAAPGDPLVNCWLAYRQLQAENPKQAAVFAERALRAKALPWAYCLLGEARLRSGDIQGARKHLDETLRLDPRRPWAYVISSEIWREMRRFDAALADLEKLVEVHPTPWSYAIRARTLFNFRDQARGLRDLTYSLKLDPDFREGRAYRAEAYRRLGRFEESLKDFNRSLQGYATENFGRGRVVSWRGATLLALGRYREAIRDFDPVIRIQPEPNISWALAQRAHARLKLGKYKEAVEDMNRAVRIDPKSGWIYGGANGAEGTLNLCDEIAALFTKALARDSSWAWGYAWRGETFARASRFPEALSDLTRAIELAPREAWFRAWRGLAKKGLGDADGAIADFKSAVRSDPRYAAVYGWLAEGLMKGGRFGEAKTTLDRYLRLEKRSAWAYAWRGECLVRGGKIAAAESDLETAVNLHQMYGDAWVWLAEARRRKGNLAGAREAADRALTLTCKKEIAYVVSGMIHADLGDPKKQLEEFEKASKLNPQLFRPAAGFST
jgi:tetratricopeptide (TPR) repeat protein